MSAEDPLHILVVDDDANLRHLVAAYLKKEGYRVTEAADGPAALQAAGAGHPDLVVLDLMLPGLSGLEVAHRLSTLGRVPILMLTARGEEEDLLRGFEAGADDYLVKPFSPRVMVARVRAILRRSGLETEDATSAVTRGDLVIDEHTRRVLLAGRPVTLTSTEFELLRVLAEHPGWVYSREDLLEQVWGYSYLGDSRLVDVHIANLRKKLGDDPSDPRYIHTVRGAGYKLQPVTAQKPRPGALGAV